MRYDEKPVYKILSFVKGNLLNNPKVLLESSLLLRKHNIETEDHWFQIGQKSWEADFWQIGRKINRNMITKNPQGEYRKSLYKQYYYL